MKSVLQLFKRAMYIEPRKVAISYKDKNLNYEQLIEATFTITENLKKLGLKKGDLIGVNILKDQNYIPIILAIWNVGCAFIPIDIEIPKERKEYILKDSNLKFIITENNCLENINRKQIVLKTEILKKSDPILRDFSREKIKGNDIAYIIYTSGTTGRPKGVMITNDNLYNLLDALKRKLKVNSNLNILSLANISFDMSISELFLPISVGGKLCISSKRCLIDMDLLKRTIIDEDINFMQATPITWKMLINSKWENESKITIACGAEKIDNELCKSLLDVSQGYIYNLYGPTETTVWASVGKINNEEDINIGKPIRNMEYYVLDENLKEVGNNEEGELFISGKGVSKGYLNNTELTKKKFVKNEHSKKYDIMYATGDIVYKAKNKYYYVNRKDFQIKINGHRIEPGEIESQIKEITNRNVVVTLKEGTLVAYIEGDNKDIRTDLIINKLEDFLPHYMVPYNYIFIDKIPLTHNRKIDRKKLQTI